MFPQCVCATLTSAGLSLQRQVFKVVVFSLCLCYTGVSLCRVQKVVSKVVVFPQCVAGCWLLVAGLSVQYS